MLSRTRTLPFSPIVESGHTPRQTCAQVHPQRRFIRSVLAVFLAFLGSSTVRAEDYVARQWLVLHGMPHNMVNSMLQDEQGYLWIATVAGLARFDGREFLDFPIEGAGAEPENVRDLAREDPNTLLFLPASGGIIRLRNGVTSAHPASAALEGQALRKLFVPGDGSLWIAVGEHAVARWNETGTKVFTLPAHRARRSEPTSFACDDTGRIWVANGDYIGWFENGSLSRAPLSLGEGAVVAPGAGKSVWISTHTGLWRFTNGPPTQVCSRREWTIGAAGIQQLFEDAEGVLWVPTRRQGVWTWNDGRLESALDMPYVANSVMQDHEGSIWITSNGGGMQRLRPKRFVLLDKAAGFADNLTQSVCEDGSGALWCANRSGGVVRYRQGTVDRFELPPAPSMRFVTTVCPDRDGRIWIGAADGIYRIDAVNPGEIVRMADRPRDVNVLFCRRNGEMWVAADAGVFGRFRGDLFEVFTTSQGAPQDRVTAIVEDATGRVIVATVGGHMTRFDGESFSPMPETSTAPNRINALCLDRRGDLWIATPRGLYLQQAGGLRRFGTEDGLPDELISQLLEDDSGRLWLTGRNDFFAIEIDRLLARASGGPAVSAISFGTDQGLPGASSPNGRQPMSWKARDGHLWFSTHAGLVGINANSVHGSRPTPRIAINEVRIDGRVVPAGEGIVLLADARRIEVALAALSFAAPERIAMRHQLVGFDTGWVATATDRKISYGRLPAGKYTLLVDASNQDGAWNPQPLPIAVFVERAWWQSPWLLVLALATFALLVGALVRHWSLRRMRRRLADLSREHALERERSRIARDLHDELGGTVTQIRLLAERVRDATADGADVHATADHLAWRARRLTREIESIIWTVNPANNSWDRLASFLSQYAVALYRNTSVACDVDGVDHIPELPLRPEQQHNVLAVAKEALNNALKHAGARNVHVSMEAADDWFHLRISDDGAGFDATSHDTWRGNGLTNMQTRASELDGRLEIDARPGAGTMIHLTVRFSAERETPSQNAASPHR